MIRKQEVLAELVDLVRQEFARMNFLKANSDDMGGADKLSKKGTYMMKYNILIVVANKKTMAIILPIPPLPYRI